MNVLYPCHLDYTTDDIVKRHDWLPTARLASPYDAPPHGGAIEIYWFWSVLDPN
jgi:hypothetical protein